MSNKKRNIIVVGTVAIILLIVIILAIVDCSRNVKDESVTNNISVKTKYSLPAFNSISSETSPLMFDFLNGTLNWHKDEVPALTKFNVIEFCYDTEQQRWYASYNRLTENTTDAWTQPLFANAPLEITDDLDSDSKRDQFKEQLKLHGLTTVEGKYEFSWIWFDYFTALHTPHIGSEGFDDSSHWNGVNLQSIIENNNNNKSEIQRNIEAGIGIDTAYLRKTEADNIMEKSHININDEFWDNVNYGMRIKSKKIKEIGDKNGYDNIIKGEYVMLTPTWRARDTGTGYEYFFSINKSADVYAALHLSECGYQSVEEALNNKSYINESDVYNIIHNK